ncbi:MAG TPA: HNH endonuclease signature motif containing protein [Candidatus Limnocylindrales bacterium]|nr:HNH endonuclease signature motif containing protein [Candidatus Limnocylindrales bacterium]
MVRLDARCRRVLGELAVALRERKAWQALGFARLSDWCRERLGISASELATMARVSARLASVPSMDAAYTRGELNWTQVRAIASIKHLRHPDLWLAEARASTGRALEAKVHALNEGVPIERIPFLNHELVAVLMAERPAATGGSGNAATMARPGAESAAATTNNDATGLEVGAACTDDAATGAEAGTAFTEQDPAEQRQNAIDTDDTAAQAQAKADDDTLYQQWWNESAPVRMIDGERAARVAVPCSERTHRLWLEACEYAARLIGREAATWNLVEAMCMEASSSATINREMLASLEGQQTAEDIDARADETERQLQAWGGECDHRRAGSRDDDGCLSALPPNLRHTLGMHALRTCHPSRLDRRMRKVVAVMQTNDARLADLMARHAPSGFYRHLGHATLEDYAHARLGICPRKTRDLLRMARDSSRRGSGIFEAYRAGKLTRAKVAALAPVSHGVHARAWAERARLVTLRRLRQELLYAKARAHIDHHCTIGPPPPPRMSLEGIWDELRRHATIHDPAAGQSPRTADESRQMRGAHLRVVPAPMPCTVSFVGPARIVEWFHHLQTCFMQPGDRRGDGLRRMLEDILAQWRALPGHRDPIFARDGWRCSVPGCTARAQLHDHHVIFRSLRGPDDPWNRVAVCLWHHQRGLHGYVIRASGHAPDDLVWQIGFKPDGTPILQLRGDYYERAPAAPSAAAARDASASRAPATSAADTSAATREPADTGARRLRHDHDAPPRNAPAASAADSGSARREPAEAGAAAAA